MQDQQSNHFAAAFKKPVNGLHLIKENPYCRIYGARLDTEPVIIKQYKTEEDRLVRLESEAVDYYHEMAKEMNSLTDSQTIEFIADQKLLCVSFVDGEPFSDFLYKARRSSERQHLAKLYMSQLGDYLVELRNRSTQPGAETDPFHFEYLRYCSERLAKIPVLGRSYFRNAIVEAEAIINEFQQAQIDPSAIHGDFVFRNIHVQHDKVGLIDFANALERSHPLSDIYNLKLALHNMLLPKDFKAQLWDSFYAKVKPLFYPVEAQRFYFEYHRRRWLMLKLYNRNPSHWMQVLRGMTGFAKPFQPEHKVAA